MKARLLLRNDAADVGIFLPGAAAAKDYVSAQRYYFLWLL